MIEPIHVWICFVVFYNVYPLFIWEKITRRENRGGDFLLSYFFTINIFVLLPVTIVLLFIGPWLFLLFGDGYFCFLGGDK